MVSFMFISFMSYNGGTWNLATRYISNSSEKNARKTAILSGVLYLTWPLILFFPMWVSPLIFPNLANPENVYSMLAIKFLPPGFVGMVLAAMFAATMSMTTSDANTISSVLTRDILPLMIKSYRHLEQKKALFIARSTTFLFTLLTIIIALNAGFFGGVLGLIISWFGALVGPTAVPMLLGLLPVFRKAGSWAAIISIVSGLSVFIINKIIGAPQDISVGAPVITSLVIFVVWGLIKNYTSKEKTVN